jgi:uncharacterized membrane protein
MTDLLVEYEPLQQRKAPTFSKIAFGFSISTFLIYVLFIANITAIIRIKSNNPAFLGITTLCLLLSMILGLVFSIISLARKEKLKYIKAIAAIINFSMVALTVGSMIFALYMDLKNMHT